MNSEQVFWFALSVIAVLAAAWFVLISAYAVHVLFKQRGKAKS